MWPIGQLRCYQRTCRPGSSSQDVQHRVRVVAALGPLTLGVHRRGVVVAAVLRDQPVPEPEHVAAGKGDLATVEAGVVHVEFGDQRLPVAPEGSDEGLSAGF
jgi:hypothetical protein